MEDILNLEHGLTQNDLNDELTNHHHPRSRKMPNGTMRKTQEAARELADHYIYVHNMKEPEYI